MKAAALIMAALVVVFTFGMWVGTKLEDPDERTCESVELYQRAFAQCLRHAASCETRTVPHFVTYYENKNWLAANCPPTDSGDGFLSQ